MAEKTRCSWARGSDAYLVYHDEEWGVPVHDDRHFFEMLVLEGAQAGLSWSTILNKRAAYRKAFARFDPKKVAAFRGFRAADAARERRNRAQSTEDRVRDPQRRHLSRDPA
jgi:DNA-3-methyladenine glycosylase I